MYGVSVDKEYREDTILGIFVWAEKKNTHTQEMPNGPNKRSLYFEN